MSEAPYSGYKPLETQGKTATEIGNMVLGQGVFYGRPRTWKDPICCVGMVLFMLLHFALLFVMLFAGTSVAEIVQDSTALGCTVLGSSVKGVPTGPFVFVNETLAASEDITTFLNSITGISGLLEKHIGIFVGALVVCVVLCVAWVFFIRYCAQVAVWGTLILKAVVYLAFGIVIFADSTLNSFLAPTLPILLFIYAFVSGVLMFFLRDKITTAAEVMRAAMKGVIANPLLILVVILLDVIMSAYQLWVIVAVVNSLRLLDVQRASAPFVDTCFLVPSKIAGPARGYSIFMMLWVICYMEAIRLFVTTVAIGDWYFPHTHSDPARKVPVFQALGWALTTNSGTLALATLPMLIAKWAKKKARESIFKNMCNLLSCFLWCLAKLLYTIMRTLSSGLIILSALSGGDALTCVRIGGGLVRRHLMNGLVVNVVGESVLEAGAVVLAIAVGFGTWFAVAISEGDGPFDDLTANFFENGIFSRTLGSILFVLYAYAIVWLLVNRWLGIILFTLLPQVLQFVIGDAGAVGVYLMALGRFIFPFMANFLLDATDATFYCFAIDQDNGGISPETKIIGPYVEIIAKHALQESNPFWVKAENAAGWENGTKITVQGLQSAVGQPYNGTSGVIQQYNKKADRYDVLMGDGKVIGLKLENMIQGVNAGVKSTVATNSPMPTDSKLLACSVCQGSFMTPPGAPQGSLMSCPHCQTQLAVP